MIYKSEETYCEVQSALFAFDSIAIDRVIEAEDLSIWLDTYSDLFFRCEKDKLFNSCYKHDPCAHSKKNIEHQFFEFFGLLIKVSFWSALNEHSESFLVDLLSSTPLSDEENYTIDLIYEDFVDTLDLLYDVDWEWDANKVQFDIPAFQYGTIVLSKKEITKSRKLAEEYGKTIWYRDNQ